MSQHPDESLTLVLLKRAQHWQGVTFRAAAEALKVEVADVGRCVEHLETMGYCITIKVTGGSPIIKVHGGARLWFDRGQAFLEPLPGYPSGRPRKYRAARSTAPHSTPPQRPREQGRRGSPSSTPRLAMGLLLERFGPIRRAA